MAVRFKVLGSGRLVDKGQQVNTYYELYKVPSGKATVISAMRFVNTHKEPVALSVMLNHANAPQSAPGNTAIFPTNYPLAAGSMLLEEDELPLANGDSIVAKVGTDGTLIPTGKIHFIISGVERDIQAG